ncbi:4'-phosphopantetheinyl transferase superfamily protein [Sphingomonas canadensis]
MSRGGAAQYPYDGDVLGRAAPPATCCASSGCSAAPGWKHRCGEISRGARVPVGVAEHVLRPSERAAIRNHPAWFDRLVFSAKEAAFKARHRLSGAFPEFHEIAITCRDTSPSWDRGTAAAASRSCPAHRWRTWSR